MRSDLPSTPILKVCRRVPVTCNFGLASCVGGSFTCASLCVCVCVCVCVYKPCASAMCTLALPRIHIKAYTKVCTLGQPCLQGFQQTQHSTNRKWVTRGFGFSIILAFSQSPTGPLGASLDRFSKVSGLCAPKVCY